MERGVVGLAFAKDYLTNSGFASQDVEGSNDHRDDVQHHGAVATGLGMKGSRYEAREERQDGAVYAEGLVFYR